MKHARPDYQKRFGADPALEDPALLSEGATPIAADEPVILLRAENKFFIYVLAYYRNLLLEEGSDGAMDMVSLLQNHMRLAQDWQDAHGCKMPDAPSRKTDEH